jgi:hypothetical protein
MLVDLAFFSTKGHRYRLLTRRYARRRWYLYPGLGHGAWELLTAHPRSTPYQTSFATAESDRYDVEASDTGQCSDKGSLELRAISGIPVSFDVHLVKWTTFEATSGGK